MNITHDLALNERLNDIIDEMEMVYKNDHRPWIIGYSGGKDSSAVVQMVFLMLKRLKPEERRKEVYVVSSDTLIENPIVLFKLKQSIDQIQSSGTELNLFAHMVHPDYNNTFWTNVIGKGLPTPTSIRFRWCTEKLKIKPSNTFIQEKVNENGEVVVLLGVRKAESIARRIRIENRQIDGYLLTPHATLINTYVYNPIVDLSVDDVWTLLLSNSGISPWGGDNKMLFNLYQGADGGECPFTITTNKKGEIETPSCGTSRFGCWICTVVSKDKSLTGFIKTGETWLAPLLEFREWILTIRNKHEYRQQYRRDGNHYYKKVYLNVLPINDELQIHPKSIVVDENGKQFINLRFSAEQISMVSENDFLSEKDKLYVELIPFIEGIQSISPDKVLEDDKGKYINVLGYGPFNFKARKTILEELLKLQRYIQDDQGVDFDIISVEELKAIDRIWQEEEDLQRNTLVDIYARVMNMKLPWHDLTKPMFSENDIAKIEAICDSNGVSKSLFTRLLVEVDKYKYFSNKSSLNKSIEKILNQRYLHKDLIEEIENDN